MMNENNMREMLQQLTKYADIFQDNLPSHQTHSLDSIYEWFNDTFGDLAESFIANQPLPARPQLSPADTFAFVAYSEVATAANVTERRFNKVERAIKKARREIEALE